MEDLYNMMLRRGLTTSRRDFSQKFCGHAPNYVASGGMSDRARIAVFNRLIADGHWLLAFRVAQSILFRRGSR